MARAENQRNVIIIISQDTTVTQAVGAAPPTTTFKGRGVEVQTDGTLVLNGSPKTGADVEAVLKQLIQDEGPGTDVPENSALYSQEDIFQILYLPESAVVVPSAA